MRIATVVIPCFNEEQRLPVERLLAFLRNRPDVEIVFVDDGSSDGTRALLTDLCGQAHANARLISLEHNRGKAEAVRVGMLAALDEGSAPYVGFWDADLSTPLEAVSDFVAVLDADPVLVLAMGARVKLLGRTVVRRATRHYTGRVFATAASLTLRLPVYDTQCGAKLFRAGDSARRLFDEPFGVRWIFDVEILARLSRDRRVPGARGIENLVYELPLREWIHVPGSRLKARDYVRAALDLTYIYRRYMRGGA
jgi:glycosyltransferase involved in cell wall biosynthesis